MASSFYWPVAVGATIQKLKRSLKMSLEEAINTVSRPSRVL